MLGLFGTLNLGARSLQTQQLGVEVAGHNLANVNNPDYSRQRVDIDTSFTRSASAGIWTPSSRPSNPSRPIWASS